jgi:hypothetical protein
VIVGIGSWRGTGATTTALLVAASIAASTDGDAPCWLVEADPAGGVLAARLQIPPHAAGGLERIAFPTSRSTSTVERFAEAAARLGGLRVVTAPGEPFRAWACHTPRLAWAPALRELDGPVIVDLGTIRGGAPHTALLGQLDLLLLTASVDPVSLVATSAWIDSLGRVSPADAGLPIDIGRVLVVDEPSSSGRLGRLTVERELGGRLAGWIPWAPAVIDAVHRGVPLTDRRLRRQPLVHAVEELAARLPGWVDRRVAA